MTPSIITLDPSYVSEAFDTAGSIILFCPESGVAEYPYRTVIEAKMLQLQSLDPDLSCLCTDLPNDKGTRLTLCRIKSDTTPFDLLCLSASLMKGALECNPEQLAIATPGLEEALAAKTTECCLASLLGAIHNLPTRKSRPQPMYALSEILICTRLQANTLDRIQAEAHGNNLARTLTNLPGNLLTPESYIEKIRGLARESGWEMEVHDRQSLEKINAGAFLAVTQANENDTSAIVRLGYRPAGSHTGPALALVGKGICFDTGGVNVKPAKYMAHMNEDMGGSAVALGCLQSLDDLDFQHPVDCWLAIAENHIGPNAYRPNDVVTASNGKTIEIVHTDAEGRMVLADTLVLANREKPALIIDFATLTGTCIQSLGTGYSGAFSNQKDWNGKLIEAGETSGERLWPFPMSKDYDKSLKSKVADLKQCTLDGEADHILAARFLSHFIDDDQPWIHIDLAASRREGGLAHITTDITGFGIRACLSLLLDFKLHEESRR